LALRAEHWCGLHSVFSVRCSNPPLLLQTVKSRAARRAKERLRRLERKGIAAQRVLSTAFREGNGVPPTGVAMEQLVEATRCTPADIMAWFEHTRQTARQRKMAVQWAKHTTPPHSADPKLHAQKQPSVESSGEKSMSQLLIGHVEVAEEEERARQAELTRRNKDRRDSHAAWLATWGGEELRPSEAEQRAAMAQGGRAEPSVAGVPSEAELLAEQRRREQRAAEMKEKQRTS
jgi:hypothetical protein